VAYSFGDCRSIQLSYGRTLWRSGSVSGPGSADEEELEDINEVEDDEEELES
jgi:hypothetical protein